MDDRIDGSLLHSTKLVVPSYQLPTVRGSPAQPVRTGFSGCSITASLHSSNGQQAAGQFSECTQCRNRTPADWKAGLGYGRLMITRRTSPSTRRVVGATVDRPYVVLMAHCTAIAGLIKRQAACGRSRRLQTGAWNPSGSQKVRDDS